MKTRRYVALGVVLFLVWSVLVSATQPSLGEAQRLFRDGRLAEAATACEAVLNADPANLDALRLGAQIAALRKDYEKAAAYLCKAVDGGGDAKDCLDLAGCYRDQFQLDKALAAYETAALRFPTDHVYEAWTRALLDFRLFAEAKGRLDDALRLFPKDAALMQDRAVLALSLGRDAEAVRWIKASWDAGADKLAWTRDPAFADARLRGPYSALLGGAVLLEGAGKLEDPEKADRMRLLSTVMDPASAPAVARIVADSQDAEVRRLGLVDLGLAGKVATVQFADLLASPDPGLRRQVLYQIRALGWPEFVPLLAAYLPGEMAPGNHDFAEVLLVQLQVGQRTDKEAAALLEAIPAGNTYRYLALYSLSDIWQKSGQPEKAAEALEEAEAGHPSAKAPEGSAGGQAGLEAYWECAQRKDIEEILEILDHHAYVERIDARVYGLPKDDFDDRQNLSISERLFLRQWAKKQGYDWRTDGVLQYPREIRHTLEDIYRKTGMKPDCSGLLAAAGPEPEVMQKDGSELKLYEDTGVDNEVNIVVNPYNQQYVVATSNAYSSTSNETYRSSNYGKSWTHGAVTQGSGACDPVSYYNRSGILYHSYLGSCGSGCGVYASYSSDNGATWTGCATVDSNKTMDREDIYIDTFAGDGGQWQASPCVDKIYVGYHNNGAQVARVSTGASSPFCTSWSSAVSLASPGNSSTISTGITSSIGKGTGSGRGTVVYTFPRYGSSSTDSLAGIYYALSTNCGTSYGTPVRISTINLPGSFEWGIPSTCSRQEYYYVQADSDRQPLSAFRNNVYVTWNDMSSACAPPGCSGNSTCNSDIFVATGVPNDRDNPTSWTWTTVNLTKDKVGTDSYTDEFYPSLTVDQADGDVYVSYYRSNSGATSITPRQQQVHYVTVRSINGGSAWQSVLQVTQLPTNEYNNGADQSMQWGDYTWVDVINGVAYPAWTDRRENADEDIWSGKVCSEPTHWVERGTSPTTPTTNTSSGATNVVNVSWALPDLFWGDGGENASARKFQLYVDGTLTQDNISATATSTSYTASNCTTSHTFRIRAVNSCGVTKDYTTATATAPCGCLAPSGLSNNTAADADACADTGVTVSWAKDAGSWGDGGSGTRTYDVLRGGTAVASAIAYGTTTYTDTAGTNGTSYTYAVRYNNGCAASATTTGVSAADNVGVAAPSAPTVADADPCARSGVQISWGSVSGATAYDLYVDSSTTVSGVTSPYVYSPADTSSHSYQVRARSASCTSAWSTAAAGTDANGKPSSPAITGIIDNNPLVQDGIKVTYTSGSPATRHDLYRDTALAVTGYASGALYDPGDSASHSYVVRAVNGTCTTDSSAQAFADAFLPAPGEVAPGGSEATAQTWSADKTTQGWPSATGAAGYKLYRGTQSELPNLLSSANEGCYRTVAGLSQDCSADDPSSVTGLFYWYLVTATNAAGEGPAGSGTGGARNLSSTTTCP